MPGSAARSPQASPLDDLRERGAPGRDPVRFRLAEALERRAAAHSGAARHVLDAKLALLLQSLDSLVTPPASIAPGVALPQIRRGALGELVDHAARHRAPLARGPNTSREATSASPGTDPTTLQFFQRTWSRLSADQRLAQSRASLPENAGPLNSHHLLHRSLTLMRELSPQYLEHFVGYIDALQWLEQANEAAAQDSGAAARAAGARKSVAARRG